MKSAADHDDSQMRKSSMKPLNHFVDNFSGRNCIVKQQHVRIKSRQLHFTLFEFSESANDFDIAPRSGNEDDQTVPAQIVRSDNYSTNVSPHVNALSIWTQFWLRR